MVVDQHECCTYQVRPENVKSLKFKDYYEGPIYSDVWIQQSISKVKEGSTVLGGEKFIQCRKEHEIVVNSAEKGCKKLIISKKKKFTITEGLKMFDLITSNHAQNLGKSNFW